MLEGQKASLEKIAAELLTREVLDGEQVRRIPIVDERGQLVGIVAQADIVRDASDRKAERTVEKISQPGGKHTS